MARAARSRRPNLGIYDPPEPSTGVLSPEAKAQWDRSFEQAMEIYGDRGIAETAAWRRVRMSFRPGANRSWEQCSGGQCKPWPRPQMLPVPNSDLVGLGVLIEYGFIDRNGDLQLRAPDLDFPPILYWDDARKMLYAFPGTPYPACMLKPPKQSNGAEIYKKWTKRDADCISQIQIPIVRMQCMGPSDTISYRSDKWKPKMDDPRVHGAQEYIHKNWHDVWLWQDDPADPSAIMIEGGALDVHAKGIIH